MPRYDVFLSHASADKPAVEHLAHKLREAELDPFLDKWHLIPGEPWQEALEEALDQSRTCAVFRGKTIGPWQNEEMRAALETRVRDAGFRVIPVLLPGGREPGKEELPRFLRRLTWVDFRASLDDEDAFRRLLAGIKGKAPGPSSGGGGGGSHSLLDRGGYRCMAPAREQFVQRSEYAKVRDALLDGSGTPTVGITTAIHGAGGFGKTALAIELCHDERVREHYPHGILWTTMGEEIDAAGRLARVRDLIRWWAEKDPPAFETVSAASAHLREELNGKRLLLVVDDVWRPDDVTPFQGLTALLVTTRDSRALPADSVPVHVDALEISEAVRLLESGLPNGTGVDLRGLATRLGEWPLLLKIVNRQLRELIQQDRLSLDLALKEVNEALDTEGLTVFDREDLESRGQAVAQTVGASLRRLSEAEVGQFEQLAIFPEDKDIPLRVLEKIWGSGSFATRKLCDRLHDLSLLLRFDRQNRTISLHDVIRAYLLKKGESHLPEWHQHLLDVFQPAHGGWPNLPSEESYLWSHLIHHLMGSGESHVCRSLLLDFQYLRSKLAATYVNAMLADYSGFAEKDEELRLVRDALRLSAHVLSKDLTQLGPQLWGRLLGHEGRIGELLRAVKEKQNGTWLRSRRASISDPRGPLIRTIEGTGLVNDLAVLDETRVVTGSEDGKLQIWNIDEGKLLDSLPGHTRRIRSVIVVAGGRMIISCSDDGTIQILDVDQKISALVFRASTTRVSSIVALDNWVISASDDGLLRVWDFQGQLLHVLKGHHGRIRAVTVLPGRKIVSCAQDQTMWIWDPETGAGSRVFRRCSRQTHTLVALDGHRVVSGSATPTLYIWDVENRKTRVLRGSSSWVRALIQVSDRLLVTGDEDGRLREWDIETGQTVRSIGGHSTGIRALAVLNDRQLISSSDDETLRIWDLNRTYQELEAYEKSVRALTLLNGRQILSCAIDGKLQIWDVESGQRIRYFAGSSDGIQTLSTLDHRRVVTGSIYGPLRVFDAESGEILCVSDGHSDWIASVAALDARRVLAGSRDGTLRLWDAESGQTLKTFEEQIGSVGAVAVMPNGRAVSGSDDRALRLWDVESGQVLQVLKGHFGEISALVVLDDRRVVSGSSDGTLRVWDIEIGQCIQVLEGHSEEVLAVAVLDSIRVVSGAKDRTLRVWDLKKGMTECSFTLEAQVNAVVVSPDNHVIVAGDDSGRVHFFDFVEPSSDHGGRPDRPVLTSSQD